LWGFANDITNPLVAAFQTLMEISAAKASMVQFAFYGGYATMAVPAALFIRKYSYKVGVLIGLCLYAVGAFLFIPAAQFQAFSFFCLSLYILTFGLAFLETSANPFILSLGPKENSTRRLNLAQAFNPVGSLSGMAVASFIVLPNLISDHRDAAGQVIFHGLSEAENERHEQFGEQRIIDITHTSSSQPQQLIEAMNLSVHAFVDGAEQSDDLTMLSIRYTRQEEEPQQGQCLVLRNDVQEVEKLAGFVEEVCEGAGVEMLTTMQINLAIEEAVVNVIDYAYPSGVQGDIRLCAIANKDTLTFVISDDGKPFDPTTRAEVDITLSAEERNIGGLGIHLVRNIMDTVSYERKDNQNVLTLIKQVKSEK
jgi:anti-sigma regulatory factor (Ser/Thr protein kinase)